MSYVSRAFAQANQRYNLPFRPRSNAISSKVERVVEGRVVRVAQPRSLRERDVVPARGSLIAAFFILLAGLLFGSQPVNAPRYRHSDAQLEGNEL